MRIIDGQIVLDASSLTVTAQRRDDINSYMRVEEDGRLINTQSYLMKSSRCGGSGRVYFIGKGGWSRKFSYVKACQK